MIYMYIFWLLVVAGAVYFVCSNSQKKENNIFMILILASAFLFVAIVSKDPIFSAFGVPVEFEWVVGIFITSFTSWKLYFAPLKERVVSTEKEIITIKSNLESIKNSLAMIDSDIGLLKDRLLK